MKKLLTKNLITGMTRMKSDLLIVNPITGMIRTSLWLLNLSLKKLSLIDLQTRLLITGMVETKSKSLKKLSLIVHPTKLLIIGMIKTNLSLKLRSLKKSDLQIVSLIIGMIRTKRLSKSLLLKNLDLQIVNLGTGTEILNLL